MINNKKILAVITARGGSKGLPDKNIKMFLNKPLICWTIEQAKTSKYIDRVIVSTDSINIANISKEYGADVPFIRPDSLSTDSASSIDVVVHAINWVYENNNENYDYVVLLQPTSPFRTSQMIDESITVLVNNYDADSVVSVTKATENPYWMKIKNLNGYLENFISGKNIATRRQDLPNLFVLNGAIYIMNIIKFLEAKSFFTNKTIPFYMEPALSVDIDDENDFNYAEFVASRNLKSSKKL